MNNQKKAKIIAALFVVARAFNELHMVYKHNYAQVKPFLFSDLSIDISWYTKFLSIAATDLLHAVIIYMAVFWCRWLQRAAIAYICVWAVDLVFFLATFSQINETLNNFIFCAAIYFICFHRPETAKKWSLQKRPAKI